MCTALEKSVALLLRPTALQMLLESGVNKWNVISTMTPQLTRTCSISLHDPDPEVPNHVQKIQDK